MSTFSDFGLLASLFKTLKAQRIVKPTEIQNNTIPLMMAGQSVVGVSETGSGKTLAYALPLLHMLKTLEDEGTPVTAEASPRAIVMVPTRELGEQVSKVFKTLTHDTRLRVRPALGGMAMEQARRNTSGAFEILLATPGRLTQLMDRDLINLTDVRMLVFDEADQMMDQGFLPDSNKVYYACPKDVQMALFSATVSTAVQDLINNLFASAEIFRSSGSGKVVQSLKTSNRIVKDGKRWPLLEKILAEPVEGGTILFTNTREQCDNLAKELADNGYEAVIYRGEMEKNDRRQNLKKFADGKVKLLVATDLAGRGLDIYNVDRVINYHLPKQKENYLHRAGRTARAGRKGLVINLVTERDERLLAQIEGRKMPAVRDAAKYASQPYVKPQAAGKGKTTEKAAGKFVAKPAAKSAKAADAKPLGKGKPSASAKPPFKGGAKPAAKRGFSSGAPKRRG
ncbi:DEAD/DEAH box helicase [Bdellovibrio svalbardensis]|uniref:DEAD/DEAH box helicase n=1 Tax=Bdellovibrio svalbardensis TaxID=2972972 RepID=A0ABT6DE98_9BACT|nr:DEAD/DEAH box helicase [Bdellovibrio svalbardensis]MDG0815159.1 DEAD/DEAH box helicase [Bdellovibrio svalbardensis]